MQRTQNPSSFAEILKIANISDDIISELSDEFKALEVTYAEKVIIFEGTKTGIANCRIAPGKYFNQWGKELNKSFVRAEILEWLFYPMRAEKIFKKGKIRIIGAFIDRNYELKFLKGFNEFPVKRKYNDSYSLNLGYTSIKIDLTFEGCTFYGGIGLTNSNTKDFVLKACRIGYTVHKDYWGNEFKNSIKADNINTNGDFKITDYHDEQIDNGIGHSAFDAFYYVTKTMVTNDIFLESAKISELLSFSYLEVKANLNLREIDVRQIYLNQCTIDGWVNLNLSTIKDVLWADGSKFLGGGNYHETDSDQNYSISAVGASFGWIAFRDSAEILNGIDLSSVKANLIMFRSSFISKNFHTGVAIALSRSEISTDIYLTKGMLISGRIDLYDSKIGRNLEFSQSKFIGSIEPTVKSLACDNIIVGNKITFTKNKVTFKSLLEELSEGFESIIQIPTPDFFKKKKDHFVRQSLELRQQSFKKFKSYLLAVESGSMAQDKLRQYFVEMCHFIQRYEQNIFFKPLDDFQISYEFLMNENINDGLLYGSEILKDRLAETSMVVGEASFSGIKLSGQFDCSNCLFVGMNHKLNNYQPKSSEISAKMRFFRFFKINIPRQNSADLNNFPNALTIKYARIDGELFLNEGPNESPIPFRAIGEVNLHSTKIGQFFVSPIRGQYDYTKWKLIGLKYDFIYNKFVDPNLTKNASMKECQWFYDYNEENNRQPYEQLATVYLKYGEDTVARDVLLNAYPKTISEGIMLSVLYFFSKIGVPHYIALRNVIFLILIGWALNYRASTTGGFAATSKIGCLNADSLQSSQVLFSPFFYSLQTVIPLMSSEQKNLFTPKFYSAHNFIFYNSYVYLDSGRVATFWLSLSTFIGIILISMFIISITRIIRRN